MSEVLVYFQTLSRKADWIDGHGTKRSIMAAISCSPTKPIGILTVEAGRQQLQPGDHVETKAVIAKLKSQNASPTAELECWDVEIKAKAMRA